MEDIMAFTPDLPPEAVSYHTHLPCQIKADTICNINIEKVGNFQPGTTETFYDKRGEKLASFTISESKNESPGLAELRTHFEDKNFRGCWFKGCQDGKETTWAGLFIAVEEYGIAVIIPESESLTTPFLQTALDTVSATIRGN
jgi:hypothetical protein